jgi:hypothetical protein
MMKIASETSISTMPQSWPGVPGRITCGGYSVQPAPVGPPGTKKLAISTITATRNTHTLSMLRYGNAMSRAPTISGIR